MKLLYDPFPIGLARPLMDDLLYRELLENHPGTDLFGSHAGYGKAGVKYALAEKLAPKKYYGFIKAYLVWRDFHAWITRGSFIEDAITAWNSPASHALLVDGYRCQGTFHKAGKADPECLRRELQRQVPGPVPEPVLIL